MIVMLNINTNRSRAVQGVVIMPAAAFKVCNDLRPAGLIAPGINALPPERRKGRRL